MLEIFQNAYVLFTLYIIITAVIARIALYFMRKWVSKVVERTKTKLDDFLLDKVKTPIFLIILLIGVKISFGVLNIVPETMQFISNIIDSAILLIAGLTAVGVSNILIKHFGELWGRRTKSSFHNSLVPLFRNLSNLLILVILVTLILTVWGFDVTGIIAGMGIAGIAIGFAVKDSLGNIFGGISLIFDRSFKIGDKIEVNGITGIIHDIGVRTTKIKTFDNEAILIPNGVLANTTIKNYAKPDRKARVAIPFSVAYGADINKVKNLVLKLLNNKKYNGLNDPAPEVLFLQMGDSSLNFSARLWVEDYNNVWPAKLGLTQDIYEALNKANIEIPFPTQTVYLRQDKKKK